MPVPQWTGTPVQELLCLVYTARERHQPVLIGTADIGQSDKLSRTLRSW